MSAASEEPDWDSINEDHDANPRFHGSSDFASSSWYPVDLFPLRAVLATRVYKGPVELTSSEVINGGGDGGRGLSYWCINQQQPDMTAEPAEEYPVLQDLILNRSTLSPEQAFTFLPDQSFRLPAPDPHGNTGEILLDVNSLVFHPSSTSDRKTGIHTGYIDLHCTDMSMAERPTYLIRDKVNYLRTNVRNRSYDLQLSFDPDIHRFDQTAECLHGKTMAGEWLSHPNCEPPYHTTYLSIQRISHKEENTWMSMKPVRLYEGRGIVTHHELVQGFVRLTAPLPRPQG